MTESDFPDINLLDLLGIIKQLYDNQAFDKDTTFRVREATDSPVLVILDEETNQLTIFARQGLDVSDIAPDEFEGPPEIYDPFLH